MNKVKRYVTVFNKQGDDEFIKEEMELKNANLLELQNLYSIDTENPMYDCFEITEKEAPYFEKNFQINFDFTKFVYYLEAYADE